MNKNQEIVDRISKLLRLADSTKNSSINEVNVALEKAHKLMREFNIDMSKVGISTFDDIKTEMQDLHSTYQYVKTLAKAASNLFNCYCYTTKRPGDHKISFVGNPTDIALCIEVFNWLQYKAKTCAKQEVGGQFGKRQRAYCDGFADAVGIKSAEMKNKSSLTPISNDDRTYALVVTAKSEAITKHLRQTGVHLVKAKARKVSQDYSTYSRGYAEGNKVNLTGFRKSLNA